MSAEGKISERLALVGTVDPGALTATTYATDVVDMRLIHELIFVMLIGSMGGSTATAQLVVYANTANSTSGGTAITGKTFTAANFSGSGTAGGDNKQGIIGVTDAEVAAALDGARYCYAVLTVGTSTSGASVVILAEMSRYEPAVNYDLASVREVI